MGWLTALREDVYPPSIRSPAGTAFSLDNAGALAWASQLAYEVRDSAKFGRIMQRWGWRPLTQLSGRFASLLPLVDTKGYIAEVSGVMVIAYAGTEPTDLFNWITDFDIHRTAGGIADGFMAGVEAVWTTLSDCVRAGAEPIYVAGHSLGAALAAVSAQRLVSEGLCSAERIAGVYTIGMPRTGDVEHAMSYNAILGDRTYRLVHGEDIVPKVPPAALGACHVGRLLGCDAGSTFAEADMGLPAIEVPGDLDVVLNELKSTLVAIPRQSQPTYPGESAVARAVVAMLAPGVRDHLCDGYLRALRVLTPAAG